MMIILLGPTASGKTQLAVQLAMQLNGEVISADSRQVYKGMDLGTGKDLSEYVIGGMVIPYHLIDIQEPGYEYNVFEFQRDFLKTYTEIKNRKRRPILCGGTGMYIEAILKQYDMQEVPLNTKLREILSMKSHQQLSDYLVSLKLVHNTTDIEDRDRLIRAIEIQQHRIDFPEKHVAFPKIPAIVLGISLNRDVLRERITKRLQERLQGGMVEEVEMLLNKGISEEKLLFYGLEYRYLTLYLKKEISYDEMFRQLNIAIHQFSKRQMTWFRRMERSGVVIHWIDGESTLEEKVKAAQEVISNFKWDK